MCAAAWVCKHAAQHQMLTTINCQVCCHRSRGKVQAEAQLLQGTEDKLASQH